MAARAAPKVARRASQLRARTDDRNITQSKSVQSAHGRSEYHAEQVSLERARTIEGRTKASASELEAEGEETPCRAALRGLKGGEAARAARRAASAACAGPSSKAESCIDALFKGGELH